MSRSVLTVIAAVSIAAIFYAVISLAEVEGAPRWVAAALGVFLGVILLLSGLVDSATAGKGTLALALTVLPRLLDWAVQNGGRAALAGGLFLAAAAFALWAGPFSVTKVTVACDDADRIAIDGGAERRCDTALTTKVWRLRWRATAPLEVACRERRGRQEDVWTVTGGGREVELACRTRPLTLAYLYNGVTAEGVDANTTRGTRILAGQERLRAALAVLPDRKKTDNLLLATWNLRRYDIGRRAAELKPEIALYIAEILSHFDIVAVQEIASREALEPIARLLGSDYAIELGAPSPGACGRRSTGGERLGLIYDRRKVALIGGKSSLVLPRVRPEAVEPDLREAAEAHPPQPCRPPYLGRFDVQGHDVLIATVHSYFGGPSGLKRQRRIFELTHVFGYLKDLATSKEFDGLPLLVAGDFNAPEVGGPEQAAVEGQGFTFFGEAAQLPTVAFSDEAYDRIAAHLPETPLLAPAANGVFRHFEYVFRDEDKGEYLLDYLQQPGADADWSLRQYHR